MAIGLVYSVFHADQDQGLSLRQICEWSAHHTFYSWPQVWSAEVDMERGRQSKIRPSKRWMFWHQLSPDCALLPRGLEGPCIALFDSFASSGSPPIQPSHGNQEICEIYGSESPSPATTPVVSHPALWRQQSFLLDPKTMFLLVIVHHNGTNMGGSIHT